MRNCSDCGTRLRKDHQHSRCGTCRSKPRHSGDEEPDTLVFTPDAVNSLSAALQAASTDPSVLALNFSSEQQATVYTVPFVADNQVMPIAPPSSLVTSPLDVTSSTVAEVMAYLPNGAGNIGRLVAPKDGKWRLSAKGSFDTTAASTATTPAYYNTALTIYRGASIIEYFEDDVLGMSDLQHMNIDSDRVVKLLKGDQWSYGLMVPFIPPTTGPNTGWNMQNLSISAEYLGPL